MDNQKKEKLQSQMETVEKLNQLAKKVDVLLKDMYKLVERYEKIIPLPAENRMRLSHGGQTVFNSTNANNSDKSYAATSNTTMFSTRYLSTKKNITKGWRSTPK